MRKTTGALSLVIMVLASSRALPDNPEALALWKGVVSHVAETQVPWQELHDYGNHVIAVSYLRDNSPAEFHPSQTEILVVQAGQGTLALGGIVPRSGDGKHDETMDSFHNNLREMHLTRGDIVHIPPNLRHQLLIARGDYLIYLTIRMNSPSNPTPRP